MRKVCICCGTRKPVREYYRHPAMADGYLGRCKVCHRSAMNGLRRSNPEKYRAKDRLRSGSPARKAQYAAKQRRMRKANPSMAMAHAQVARALKGGSLIRPPRCSRCPSTTRVQAHHDDYFKPLDVMWLCPICHAARHVEIGRVLSPF